MIRPDRPEPWASVLFNGLMLVVLALIFIAWTATS